jgi:putative heme-binding domain-containing protein
MAARWLLLSRLVALSRPVPRLGSREWMVSVQWYCGAALWDGTLEWHSGVALLEWHCAVEVFMKRRSWLVACLVVAMGGAVPIAQHGYTRAEVENGARLYQASCATCHGPRGDTVRSVALFSGQFRRATTDDQLVRIVTGGIPGTAMAPNNYSDVEAGMIVAYLRGVASGENVQMTAGDLARGRTLFSGKGKCTGCHNDTSRMAPHLADVGAIRRPLELERALLDPSADLHADFRVVRVVTKSGTVVTGRLLNQSTFSVQILDASERLRAFDRADLKEVVIMKTSEMPSYRDTLDTQEIADIVAYLTSLRGQR